MTPFILLVFGIVLIFLIFFSVHIYKIMGMNRLLITNCYTLLDIVAGGIQSILHKETYLKLRDLPPQKFPKNKREEVLLMRDFSIDTYQNNRNKLIKMMHFTQDPIQKERLKTVLTEMDGAFNLMCTLDSNSSDDYIQNVMNDLHGTLSKVLSMREL